MSISINEYNFMDDREKIKCILEGCNKPLWCRGLCVNDYQSALHEVNAKNTTWEELEKQKLCLPEKVLKNQGGGKKQ